jgi:hypothetical protein
MYIFWQDVVGTVPTLPMYHCCIIFVLASVTVVITMITRSAPLKNMFNCFFVLFYFDFLIFTQSVPYFSVPVPWHVRCVLLCGCAVFGLSYGAATQSIAFAMYALFAMHGENSCLYGQCNGPHRTAYALFAMLAMLLRSRGV